MTELLADPKVTDALAAHVVAILVAMTGVVALVASQVRRWLEAKFAHVLEGVEEARAAALSADAAGLERPLDQYEGGLGPCDRDEYALSRIRSAS